MNSVNLRLNLFAETLAKLTTVIADQSGKFKHFTRIKNAKYVGSFYEVDLSILNAYDLGLLNEEGEHVAVTREMVGELFDLLGIFPRAEKPTEEMEQHHHEERLASETGIYKQ